MLAWLLLVLTPVPLRCTLDADRCTVWSVFASAIPLLTASAGGLVAHRYNGEVEHVYRHILYAFGFGVGAATLIEWGEVSTALKQDRSWAKNLVLFCASALISLVYFAIAHVYENSTRSRLRTHRGDVVILPFTLIAIPLLLQEIPINAFVLCRTTFVTVPVVVAWSTIFLIAHADFANNRDTRLTQQSFMHCTNIGTFVAAATLLLLEFEATPAYYFVIPASLTMLTQIAPSSETQVTPSSVPRLLFSLLAALPSATLLAVWLHHPWHKCFWGMAAISFLLQETGLRMLGAHWHIPCALVGGTACGPYVALITTASADEVVITVFLFTLCVLICTCTLGLIVPDRHTVDTEVATCPFDDPPPYNPPQEKSSIYDQINYQLPQCVASLCPEDNHAWLLHMARMSGVTRKKRSIWWLCDHHYSESIAIFDEEWLPLHPRTICNEKYVSGEKGRVARTNTVGGAISHLLGRYRRTRMSLQRDGHWLWSEEHVELLPGVTWPRYGMWTVRNGSDDEMMRMHVSSSGQIAYQYKLKRLATVDEQGQVSVSSHFENFLKDYNERWFIF